MPPLPLSVPASVIAPKDLVQRVEGLVRKGLDPGQDPRAGAAPSGFWQGLTALGTQLWLDTGDISAASALWCREFSALTTNNTLLNKEVQRGTYDRFVEEVAKDLADLDGPMRILEIGFILNARHALRLVSRFGCKVSVELSTELAHDVERSVFYGIRFFNVCPENFIIKIPLTPSGLISARALRAKGIPVNFTLGFSARHNHVATAFAKPSYVDVFLGRLNAYVSDNKLGDGKMVGERALIGSQQAVDRLVKGWKEPTRQIAASMRDAGQVRDLAGCDVYTMPTAVAESSTTALDGRWRNCRDASYAVSLAAGVPADVLDSTYLISDRDRRFTDSICTDPPSTASAMVERAQACGARDFFPVLTKADQDRIAKDGKIPKHPAWSGRIAKGELAVDTLLNLAGLASFTADQAALDERIRTHLKA